MIVEGAQAYLRDDVGKLATFVIQGIRDPAANVRETALVALDEMSGMCSQTRGQGLGPTRGGKWGQGQGSRDACAHPFSAFAYISASACTLAFRAPARSNNRRPSTPHHQRCLGTTWGRSTRS